MPRPRTPTALAKITGAASKNPKRFEGRASPQIGGLGPAPQRLTPIQREAWDEMASELPWLTKSDRTLLEIAAKLKARLMTEPELGVNALAQLRLCLSSMGATPVDRSKVSAADEDDEDPLDQFIQ